LGHSSELERIAMTSNPQLAAALTSTPEFESALSLCVRSLRQIADYELDPTIDRRLRELGERKEFLDQAEHDALLALVEFSQRRSQEKLQAQLALKRLGEFMPEMVQKP
jgi:hypothetical protein